MGQALPFSAATLFCGVIYRDPGLLAPVRAELSHLWSEVEIEADPVPFDFTDYYEAEMGTPLFRTFWAFRGPLDPSRLADCKRETDELEARWCDAGRRRINLDPGYLNLHQVVLATTKNQAHRIPLQYGIYAHLELLFQGGAVVPLPWTYPDFRSGTYHEFFLTLRRRLADRVKGERGQTDGAPRKETVSSIPR